MTADAAETLRRKIEALEQARAVTADAAAAFALGEQIADARAEWERLTGGVMTAPDRPLVDVTRVDRYAPELLVGREPELALLTDAWAAAQAGTVGRPHVLAFVALGGEGKTSLVASWLAGLAGEGWPGCEAAFGWSFYSQGTHDETLATADLFLAEALRFFGDAAAADSALPAEEKARRLAELVAARRAVLVLDGLEPLQYPPAPPHDGALRDQGMKVLLKRLAAQNPGVCVVTTRYSLPDLRAYRTETAPEHALPRLPRAAGVALLRSLEVTGPDDALSALVEELRGHALALNLVGTFLRDGFGGDVAYRDRVELAGADALQGGHAFRVMDAYIRWLDTTEEGRRALALLTLVGLFDRPVPGALLDALTAAPTIAGLTDDLAGLTAVDRNLLLARLERARLLGAEFRGADAASVDAHPVVREYFANRLRAGWAETWRAGHRRVFEHLVASTVEGDTPSLEDLQPLLQAVAHGCHAGLHQQACDEVYWQRIYRGAEGYAHKKLGAFGPVLAAVACFFDTPWTAVTANLTPTDRNWITSEAGYALRALGRFDDAAHLFTTGLVDDIAAADWENAAITAGNLSGLWVAAGHLDRALAAAEDAITHADTSQDPFERIVAHSVRGHARHQYGDHTGATTDFTHAETLQTQQRPDQPTLTSLRGFRYCELLLADTELAAWHHHLHPTTPPDHTHQPTTTNATQRAHTARTIAEANNWLLDIGLAALTTTRATLYHHLLTHQPLPHHLTHDANHTVTTLRNAGQQDYLVPALLTRAWIHAHNHNHTAAHTDLDDAWDLANQGPMPLHQTDTLLHRTRLYATHHPYPWTNPHTDLHHAQHLITTTHYHRRQPELDHARVALSPKDPR